jgi:hypothetical protein
MRSTLLDRSRGRSTGTTGEVQTWIQVAETMEYPYGLVLDVWQMSLPLNYARFGISDRRMRPDIWVADGLSASRGEVQSVSFQQSAGSHTPATDKECVPQIRNGEWKQIDWDVEEAVDAGCHEKAPVRHDTSSRRFTQARTFCFFEVKSIAQGAHTS